MYPILQVRPLIDPSVVYAMKQGSHRLFTPAATVTFGDTRQSKRALAREFDKAKRRVEDWDKRHASAEPVFIGSFPAYSALGTRTTSLVGMNPPGQEMREYQVVTEGTLKVNAGTGQVQAADFNILAVALYKRIRATLFGNADNYNLTAAEARTIAFVAESRDSAQQDPNLKIGTPLTTTAIPVKLKIKIPFVCRSLEVPEIFSVTTDQMNLTGNKIDLDTQGDALTTVALTSGAGTFAVTDVKLYAIINQIPVLFCGPPHVWKSKQMAQNIDNEYGQGVDLFVASEEAATAAAAGVRVSQWTVRRDSRAQPLNIDPVTLATQFNESNFTVDALAPLDITTGIIPRAGVATAAQPVPDASIGSQLGAAVTPLEWNDGRIRAGAWQWPFYLASRQVQVQVNPGQAVAGNLLYWQVRPITENAGQFVALAAANGLSLASLDELKVRGINDGEVNKLFKGRFIAKKVIPRAA